MRRPHLLLAVIITTVLFPAFGKAQHRIGTGTVRALYDLHCAVCHGENLEGRIGASLVDDAWGHGGTDDAIAASISSGYPDLGMDGWSATLSEKQIRSLVILIREEAQLQRAEALIERMTPIDGVTETERHRYRIEQVAEGTGILWSIDFLPDGSIISAQRDGLLWIFKEGKRIGPIAATPKVWQHGQGGLMEAAVHPDFEANGWIYLAFSESAGEPDNGKEAGMTAIVRGRIKDGRWVNEESIFRVPLDEHTAAGQHFGTRIVFQRGYLFFSIGDRGRRNSAQDLSKHVGKIYRIHDDGRIPSDNPFVGKDGSLPGIWSFGHRNPQGLDTHPLTGELWSTEHGPRGGDEINLIRPGLNYGWPVITYGMHYSGDPLTDRTHQEGMEQPRHYWVPSIAVCGIDFYEGDAFPGWKYDLFAAGLASRELHRISIDDGQVTGDEIILKGRGRVRDVATGPDGLIYVSLTTGSPPVGRIYRLMPVP